MALIRYILICIIGYLVVRALLNFNNRGHSSSVEDISGKKNPAKKKISKEVGEYVDYEEIKKKKEKQH
jgi:hypothetical protein